MSLMADDPSNEEWKKQNKKLLDRTQNSWSDIKRYMSDRQAYDTHTDPEENKGQGPTHQNLRNKQYDDRRNKR